MKKILYIANLNANKLGSIEEHALFLSREIRRRGHLLYVGFISEPTAEIKALFVEAGAEIVKVYCGDTPLIGNKARMDFGEMFSLYRLIKEHGIDLVHLNFVSPTNPSLLGIYLTSAKILFTEHSSGLPLNRSLVKHCLSSIFHFFLSRRVSRYVGVSEYVSRRLHDTHHVSGDKVVTIYNGVSLDRFRARDAAEARQKLGVPLEVHVLCAVAMLIPEKGLQYLLQAVAILVHELGLNDVLLLIAGDGLYGVDLEAISVDLDISDNVRFLGRRSDVHDIIAASDVVVVPSVWEEAFGLIIAEAMASGKPVIASRSGGIPELVEDGVTGHLVTPGNAREIAKALKQLIDQPEAQQKMGQSAQAKATREFDLVKQVEKLVALYEN